MSKESDAIENIKGFKLKSDFVEKNIVIPVIIEQIKTISFLFVKMEEIYNQIQNEQSEYAQRYVRDFNSMMVEYYISKFRIDNQGIREQATKEAEKARELLLSGISSHLKQYMSNIKNLGEISGQENNIEKISEYMIKVKTFMLNIEQMKNKIFNIVLPMTTLTFIDSNTQKEIQTLYSDNPIAKIGLLPFETMINEIALLCDNGIKSIDSWFDHLRNKRIQYLESIVNQSKVQAAQEQTKAAKWTFFVQLGFIVLSFSFVVASFCLSEYKKDWIDFFTNEQSIDKTLVEKNILPTQPSTNEKVEKNGTNINLEQEKKLKEVPPINKDKVQK